MNNNPIYKKDFGTKDCEECKGSGWDNWYDKQCKTCLGEGILEKTMEDHDDWLESKREELKEKCD